MRFRLALLLSLFASLMISTAPTLGAYTAGVSTGNYVRFQINASWTGGTPSSMMADILQQAWVKISVQSVVATNVSAQHIIHYKNGTETTDTLLSDLAKGNGNLSIAILPSGLKSGDTFPVSFGAVQYNMTMNSTLTRTYAGASRSVNLINSTHLFGNYTTFYWDKATGFLLEWLLFASMQGWTAGWLYNATQTNLWSPVPTIPSNPPILVGILLATISTYFAARRRR